MSPAGGLSLPVNGSVAGKGIVAKCMLPGDRRVRRKRRPPRRRSGGGGNARRWEPLARLQVRATGTSEATHLQPLIRGDRRRVFSSIHIPI